MNISKYTLVENDLNDFQIIFQKLDLPLEILINLGVEKDNSVKKIRPKLQVSSEIPSVKDFPTFKRWVLKKVKDIERII